MSVRSETWLALAVLAVLAVGWLMPAVARAYCRTTTVTQKGVECINDEDAVLLFWDRDCIDYIVHEQLFERIPALSEARIREILRVSFDAWHAVDCGGPPFVVGQLPGTTAGEPVEFNFDARNEMVISALTPEEWRALGRDELAFAITFTAYNTKTGRIYDVDLALNLGRGPFVDCDEGCRGSETDLQNTLTHEAGHVFGLSHSAVPGATMAFSAQPGETYMRDLEPDDREGLCAIGLPGLACADESSCTCPPAPIIPKVIKKHVSSCSAGPSAGHIGVTGLAPAVLLLVLALGRHASSARRPYR